MSRARPQMRSESSGFRLCGMADEPVCPAWKRLLNLPYFRPLQAANFSSELLK